MSPQESVAHYRIISKLGEGGMGAVYRATDTRLHRDVAIKMLPQAWAQDDARMQRFQREAQVLASLNHPNIAAIYGIEQSAIVMELVEGEELRGPLPVATALNYASQIAAGLEAAHEKGIIHRDLKPPNIKVTADGVVKLLDFGLAKAADHTPASASASQQPTISPTLSLQMTQAGVILGTAAYMAPEQARGKPVDKRADIWAFGVVVYEMLTGQGMFTGETVADVLAAVMTREPDWRALPPDTPPHLRLLLERCLRKDPKKRLRDIGDARLVLEEPGAPSPAATPPPARSARLPWVLCAIASVAALALGAVLWNASRPVAHPLLRLLADMGPDVAAGGTWAILSPDGGRLAYRVRGETALASIGTRLVSQTETTILSGTAGAVDLAFSPDGEWIGFSSNGSIQKASIHGGTPKVLCPTPAVRGIDWGADQNIVVGLQTGGLLMVPAAGGSAKTVGKPREGEATQRWPQILPGGKTILFTGHTALTDFDEANIEVLSLETGVSKIVHSGGYFGRYLPTGHLVYIHQGKLFAVPFNLARNEVEGTPAPVLADVAGDVSSGAGRFSFSRTGTFLYRSGKPTESTSTINRVDDTGKSEALFTASDIWSPRVSPDGRRFAFARNGDIGIYDFARGNTTWVVHNGGGLVDDLVWTPDSRRLVYHAKPDGAIWQVRSDGSAPRELLYRPQKDLQAVPGSFTPDGRNLAFAESNADGRSDLWILPVDNDPAGLKPGTPKLFLRDVPLFPDPAFSPDGRWLAYVSRASGKREVFVRPFPEEPGGGGQVQISAAAGGEPRWSLTSKELFYRSDHIMLVPYTIKGREFEAAKPRQWANFTVPGGPIGMYDVSPDGKHLVGRFSPEPENVEAAGNLHLVFLVNFFDHLGIL
jgi:serine/threonine-protein kinase